MSRLSDQFEVLGFVYATCKLCGTKVRRNSLAYSGHVRGKKHRAAVEERESGAQQAGSLQLGRPL